MRTRGMKQDWAFLAIIALNLIAKTFANSSPTNLDAPRPDASQISDPSSPEGFKPSSISFIRVFSPNHSQNASNDSSSASDPHSSRLPPGHFKLDILKKEDPVIIKLYNGNSTPAETPETKIESDSSATHFPEKSSRIYYGDIPRNRGQGLGYPSPSLNEITLASDPRRPIQDEFGYKFYFPDPKYSKNNRESVGALGDSGQLESHTHIPVIHNTHHVHSPIVHTHNHGQGHAHIHAHGVDQSHIRTHGHEVGHPHLGHHGPHHAHAHVEAGVPSHDHHETGGHGHSVRGVVSGHGHDLGYGPAQIPFNYPPPHYGGNGHSGDVQGFIGGPALGKALSLLIPSALLLTGVSALFPKRVQVPTQPLREYVRQKRSTGEQLSYEIVPSQLLRREHRGNGQHEIFDYSNTLNNPYVFRHLVPQPYAVPEIQTYNENHRPIHAPPIAVQHVPSFQPFPQHDSFTDLDPRTISTLLPGEEPSFSYADQHQYDMEQHGGRKAQNEEEQNQNAKDGERENYDAFTFKDFSNPEVVGTIPPEMMSPVPNTFSKPTASTRAIKAATPPISNTVGPTPYKLKRLKPKVEPTLGSTSTTTRTILRRRKQPARNQPLQPSKGPELTKTSASNIVQQVQKDSTKGKGTAKLLRDLVMANEKTPPKEFDLSATGPVIGLLAATMEHQGQSETCQRRALCEIALKGSTPTATKFETFLWSLATLMPDAFTTLYDIDDVFVAIRTKTCYKFRCANPDLNIQE